MKGYKAFGKGLVCRGKQYAEALIRANCAEMAVGWKINTMADLHRVFSGKQPRVQRQRRKAAV